MPELRTKHPDTPKPSEKYETVSDTNSILRFSTQQVLFQMTGNYVEKLLIDLTNRNLMLHHEIHEE